MFGLPVYFRKSYEMKTLLDNKGQKATDTNGQEYYPSKNLEYYPSEEAGLKHFIFSKIIDGPKQLETKDVG